MAATVESVRESAQKIAREVIAPRAAQNDKEGRFPSEAISALGERGLLGVTVPATLGGLGLGPRAFAEATALLAEADPSVAMIFTMHVSATAVIAGAQPQRTDLLRAIAAGKHLTTLALSESGSRSHFWAPVSRARKDGANVILDAKKSWVTSAGHADSYVVTTLAAGGGGPTDTTLYLVLKSAPGLSVAGAWDGLGLRANASSPMALAGVKVSDADRLTDEGAGFKSKVEVVLPIFNLGSAAMSLGLARATLAAAKGHVRTAKFEHLGQSIAEALPTVRAQIAEMQSATDGLAARIEANIAALQHPTPATMLSVLEVKAAAAETAIFVTDLAMRACGGAAFSRHLPIERLFRDARASAVMAPTTAVLHDLLAKAVLELPLF